jgi:ABC-2 type transport system ATP-binding protein
MDPFVSQGLAEGLSMGRLPKDKQDFLYRNSLASYCAGENNTGNISKIDALYWQSSRDTLFNLNDSYRNYQCLKAAGGDVRLLVKAPGHDGGGSEQCGKLNKDKSIVAWFNQKLKGQAGVADYIPEFCFHLGDAGDDGVVTTTFPYGGQSFTMPMQSNNLAQEGSPQTVSFELTKIEADAGAVLAGIPTIELKATDPAGLNAAQPVFFVALAKRAAGATSDTVLMGNQAQPMRGYGTFNTELVGVTARLAKGDSLRLVVQMSNALRYSGMGSRTPAAVNVAATVKVPLLSGSLPAPPAQ